MTATTTVKKVCRHCGEEKTFHLDDSAYFRWKRGVPVQHAFPKMSPGDRELLLSSICGDCFCDFFPEEDVVVGASDYEDEYDPEARPTPMTNKEAQRVGNLLHKQLEEHLKAKK